MSSQDWLERVAGIRQWAQDGKRAPHKPLLVLYSLGRLHRFGSSRVSFREAEEPLKRLLSTYGPPGVGATPQYPFRRLENDGLWEVDVGKGPDPGERITGLRTSATGGFSPDFEAALSDPALRSAVAHYLLDEHFPPSLHDDLLADVGIEPGDLAAAWTSEPKEKRPRDPEFREHVLVAYEYRCAFCGYDGRLGTSAIGLEAAHVQWHALGGPDTVDNGIGLCTLHHKLLDKGAMGITPDHAVAVSQHFVGRGQTAEATVLALAGRPVLGPQSGAPPVSAEHIEWHLGQVFRGPARIV